MSIHARVESKAPLDLFTNLHDGVFVIDRRRTYVYFSPGCERITGHTADEILGAQCTYGDVVVWRDKHGRVLTGVLCPTRALFDGTRDAARQRMELTRRDGIRRWVDTFYTALKDDQGKVDCVIGIVHQLSNEDLMRSPQGFDDTGLGSNREASLPASGQNAAANFGHSSAAAPSGANGESMSLDKHLEDVERQAILRALAVAGWQRNKAAELMGISRSRLYRRMEALGIDPSVK